MKGQGRGQEWGTVTGVRWAGWGGERLALHQSGARRGVHPVTPKWLRDREPPALPSALQVGTEQAPVGYLGTCVLELGP